MIIYLIILIIGNIFKNYNEKELTLSIEDCIDAITSQDLDKEINGESGNFDSSVMDFICLILARASDYGLDLNSFNVGEELIIVTLILCAYLKNLLPQHSISLMQALLFSNRHSS